MKRGTNLMKLRKAASALRRGGDGKLITYGTVATEDTEARTPQWDCSYFFARMMRELLDCNQWATSGHLYYMLSKEIIMRLTGAKPLYSIDDIQVIGLWSSDISYSNIQCEHIAFLIAPSITGNMADATVLDLALNYNGGTVQINDVIKFHKASDWFNNTNPRLLPVNFETSPTLDSAWSYQNDVLWCFTVTQLSLTLAKSLPDAIDAVLQVDTEALP